MRGLAAVRVLGNTEPHTSFVILLIKRFFDTQIHLFGGPARNYNIRERMANRFEARWT